MRQYSPFLKPILFSAIFFLIFTSCTKPNQKPYDAESVMGRTSKAFFNTASPGNGSAVLMSADGQTFTRYSFNKGINSSGTALDPNQIQLSADGTVLIIMGQAGIFEYSSVNFSSIQSGSAPLPPATIETYCTGLGSTPYDQLEVVSQSGGVAFLGITKNSSTSIGGDGAITRVNEPTYLAFQKERFGTLTIDKTQSLSSDPTFFKASISLIEPNLWSAVNAMYCHLNNVSVLNLGGSAALTVHTLFMTKNSTDGNMGGLSGADAFCATAAHAGSKTGLIKGNWRAILSSSQINAKDRLSLTPGAPVMTVNGMQAVATSIELWSGKLFADIAFDENGNPNGSLAYTGSRADGTSASPNDSQDECFDWTSNTNVGAPLTGYAKFPGGSTAYWLGDAIQDGCQYSLPIYCINSNE